MPQTIHASLKCLHYILLASISVRNVRNLQNTQQLQLKGKTDSIHDINRNTSGSTTNLTYYHNMDNYIKSDHHQDVYFQQDERYDPQQAYNQPIMHHQSRTSLAKSTSQRDLIEQHEREQRDSAIRVSNF